MGFKRISMGGQANKLVVAPDVSARLTKILPTRTPNAGRSTDAPGGTKPGAQQVPPVNFRGFERVDWALSEACGAGVGGDLKRLPANRLGPALRGWSKSLGGVITPRRRANLGGAPPSSPLPAENGTRRGPPPVRGAGPVGAEPGGRSGKGAGTGMWWTQEGVAPLYQNGNPEKWRLPKIFRARTQKHRPPPPQTSTGFGKRGDERGPGGKTYRLWYGNILAGRLGQCREPAAAGAARRVWFAIGGPLSQRGTRARGDEARELLNEGVPEFFNLGRSERLILAIEFLHLFPVRVFLPALAADGTDEGPIARGLRR